MTENHDLEDRAFRLAELAAEQFWFYVVEDRYMGDLRQAAHRALDEAEALLAAARERVGEGQDV